MKNQKTLNETKNLQTLRIISLARFIARFARTYIFLVTICFVFGNFDPFLGVSFRNVSTRKKQSRKNQMSYSCVVVLHLAWHNMIKNTNGKGTSTNYNLQQSSTNASECSVEWLLFVFVRGSRAHNRRNIYIW